MSIEQDIKAKLLETVNQELERRRKRSNMIKTMILITVVLVLVTLYVMMAG